MILRSNPEGQIKKKKNAGVKVSFQYHAVSDSWIEKYFLSFHLFLCKEMVSLLVSAYILYILSEDFLFFILFD